MSKMIDLTGQKFGDLTVVSRAENTKGGQARWNCKCKCGKELVVCGCDLRKGIRTDCGKHKQAWNFDDLTGKRFGRLTVIDRAKNYRQQVQWNCVCDCGKKTVVRALYLRNGMTKSCGCYKSEVLKTKSITHGMSHSRLWRIWNCMHIRCEREYYEHYQNYGGRGISVCDEWKKFAPFMEWATKNGYAENLTIDRIDVNGNYCPENCRWITMREQAKNRNSNRLITYNGETKILQDWARELNVDPRFLSRRLDNGWSVERAFTEPKRKQVWDS